MAANHKSSYVMNTTMENLCNIIKSENFSQTLNIEMKSENPTDNGVWYRFHHGVTFTSWGEKITITLTRVNSEMTTMEIHSECGLKTQVIDWGKNKRNVCNIYEEIERGLSPEGAQPTAATPAPSPTPTAEPAAPAAEPAPAAPAPTVEPAMAPEKKDKPVINFCSHCGTKVAPGSIFCSQCGTLLK